MELLLSGSARFFAVRIRDLLSERCFGFSKLFPRLPANGIWVTLRMTSYTLIAIMIRSSTLRRYRSRLWRTSIQGLLNQMFR
ncbi:vegetative cell wall protein gp1-like [Iris pallida]|uniref:Vegetative cell wall protein gp1-like n=2 Tax=Iris pallida TaxID=29817 RepID=A0AAX6I6L5_IRIPA|nr:vegetative cell wall protein gp1-like [Iris pallida]